MVSLLRFFRQERDSLLLRNFSRPRFRSLFSSTVAARGQGRIPRYQTTILASGILVLAACQPKSAPSEQPVTQHHTHVAPHGGTPIVLDAEVYHLELVREGEMGKLTAYLLDGEMENFIRSTELSLIVDAKIDQTTESLVLRAVANAATGETVGDTSQFEAQAAWLKTVATFDATLRKITVRGSTFENVAFNFPRGNDKD